MTAAQFRAWMQRHGYTVEALAGDLDLSPRAIAYYRSGEQTVPRVVELALKQLTTERSAHEKRP